MTSELMLAAFIMAVGLAVAAAGTHLYQGVYREPATLRYDGETYLGSLGLLLTSFVCGPYIMLQLGWRQEEDGTLEVGSVLVSSLVSFGWAFITGLVFMAIYVTVTP